jgi:hypothetical protein
MIARRRTLRVAAGVLVLGPVPRRPRRPLPPRPPTPGPAGSPALVASPAPPPAALRHQSER